MKEGQPRARHGYLKNRISLLNESKVIAIIETSDLPIPFLGTDYNTSTNYFIIKYSLLPITDTLRSSDRIFKHITFFKMYLRVYQPATIKKMGMCVKIGL